MFNISPTALREALRPVAKCLKVTQGRKGPLSFTSRERLNLRREAGDGA